MKILITGGAGFIGSHIVDLCQENDHKVVVIDDFSSGRKSNLEKFRGEVVCASITEVGKSPLWHEIIRDFRPEAIIHQAAQPSLLKSEKAPRHDANTNILGTINMLGAAQRFGVKRFVFASTSAIYSDTVQHMSENDIKYGSPGSNYGISKLSAEHYVKKNMPEAVIFRYGNVYGPRQRPLGENQLIPRAIKHILENDEFEVYGDGRQTRDFVYVGDVAKANLLAAEGFVRGTFNLASGKSASVNEILSLLKEISGWEGTWKHGERRDKRMFITMNNDRLRNVFGMNRFKALKSGLKETYKWWTQ